MCSHPLSNKSLFYLLNWKFSCPWLKKMRFLSSRHGSSLFLPLLSECAVSSSLNVYFLINKNSLHSLVMKWQSIRNISIAFLGFFFNSFKPELSLLLFFFAILSLSLSLAPSMGGAHHSFTPKELLWLMWGSRVQTEQTSVTTELSLTGC